ncbi:XRN 5'-3' exonuclease N-terminus-domain-containing protein [Chytriomyces sp. MP71]|nr:XRN 5'-3' exonuclease N-terminus-domain-containing protein [Chytriomyces sp. MP71]
MGIPKFFRWISERYPLCSNLITENRIPEFDNLYLDMNGIIHPCSHPNDDNPHFRITEEQIFLAIFNYIDALFTKIKPKKVFFMAVDGVAPRAKMNQQRSRRFRTAKDAEDARRKALAKGEELPKEKAFDSNCITPGTPFMARLSENLKYFIAKKISEDEAWASITVVLSGHDVPGEGEHKIMEYIRACRASENYVPNTRHCLYGLDADLMMLGLLSHEPHFALLREEVTFGGKSGGPKKTLASSNPDAQNFYLMHLSLFREYLNLEFASLQDSLLGFDYNLEHVIDDFILLSFFVGNDFLPHLPGLHINEGALATFFKIYKERLPNLGGYINENGLINLDRLENLLEGIGEMENDVFLAERGDSRYVEGKKEPQQIADGRGGGGARGRRKGKGKGNNVQMSSPVANGAITPQKPPLYLSREQKAVYIQIRDFITAPRKSGNADDDDDTPNSVFFPNTLLPNLRQFIIDLSKELGLRHGVAFDPSEEIPRSQQTQKLFVSWEGGDLDDEDDEESNEARMRVLKRYDFAEVMDATDLEFMKEQEGKVEFDQEFAVWKADYYREKLEINARNPDELSKIVYHYVEGLQWVLLYYYHGVPSWEWFFPYHYAPKITDLRNIGRFHPIKFDKGQPFLPFYQLMGVLPAASKELIPAPFRDLMTDPGSPILDFYPTEFELDLNGKKQDWEAVIKIPFIDEVRLIRALTARESQLTQDERVRNSLGVAFKFQRNPDKSVGFYHYPSPSEIFPDISKCCCLKLVFDTTQPVTLKFGLLPGNKSNFHAGFPSLNTLQHNATLGYHGVAVFQSESQRETMVVTLTSALQHAPPTPHVALRLLQQRTVFIGWPFLIEALVVSVCDEMMSYRAGKGLGSQVSDARDVASEPQTDSSQDQFYDAVEKTEATYSKRFGTMIGPVEIVVNAKPLKGMTLSEDGALVKDFGEEASFAYQTIVEGKEHEDPRYVEMPPPSIADEFYVGSNVFFLGPVNYGTMGEVQGYNEAGDLMTVKLSSALNAKLESGLKFTHDLARLAEREERYTPAFQICKSLRLSSLALSKLTSSFFVIMSGTKGRNGGDDRANLGLNMKFEGKGKKVLGMTRKNGSAWEYSNKAIELIQEYMTRFPEIVQGIERSRGGDMFADRDFFSSDKAADRVSEIKTWLKSVGVKDFEKVSLQASALTKPYVQKIEQSVDAMYADSGNNVYQKSKIIKNVPRNAVLKPSHAPFRCGLQHFNLGDRVVSVAATGIVPLGALGTVIGVEGGRVLDVVFDVPFMSGVSLEGRCSPNRGMSVYKESLLNTSHPQSLSGTTATTSAKQGNSNVPDRIPGKPLYTPQDRERASQPVAMKKPAHMASSVPRGGIVTTNVETNGHGGSSSSRPGKSAWIDGPNNGYQAVKAHPAGQLQKKPSVPNVKQQHTQILTQGSAPQPKPQSAPQPKPNPVPKAQQMSKSQQPAPAPASEVDQMTQNLKSMLHIGGGASAGPQQAPAANLVVATPAPTQDISHQILSMMGSSSNTYVQQTDSPYQVAAGNGGSRRQVAPNELQQLMGGGPMRPQFYPPQGYGNGNYYPPQNEYMLPAGYMHPASGGYMQPPYPMQSGYTAGSYPIQPGFVAPQPQPMHIPAGFVPQQNQEAPIEESGGGVDAAADRIMVGVGVLSVEVASRIEVDSLHLMDQKIQANLRLL